MLVVVDVGGAVPGVRGGGAVHGGWDIREGAVHRGVQLVGWSRSGQCVFPECCVCPVAVSVNVSTWGLVVHLIVGVCVWCVVPSSCVCPPLLWWGPVLIVCVWLPCFSDRASTWLLVSGVVVILGGLYVRVSVSGHLCPSWNVVLPLFVHLCLSGCTPRPCLS